MNKMIKNYNSKVCTKTSGAWKVDAQAKLCTITKYKIQSH